MNYKNCMLPLLLIVQSTTAISQSSPHLYGKISKEEIELNSFPGDKGAEAIVLYDIGKSFFVQGERGFDVHFERMAKIKILTSAGLDYANIEIPFYQEGQIYERIVDLEATTYNFTEGKIKLSKLDIKNCFDEKKNEYWNLKKFAMPDVKEGSIIEFKYKIVTPYIFNLRDWSFQWKIPVLTSEYTVKIIPFYEYSFILQGTDKLDVMTSYVNPGLDNSIGGVKYKEMVYRFGMSNVPAFRDEEFITSYEDYIIKLDFQLSKFTGLDGISTTVITTWQEMINELLKHEDFGKYIDKVEKTADKIFNYNNISALSIPDKSEELINYVKTNYNWNGWKGKYSLKTLKEFQTEKTGNTANLNLFLTGLLRAAGIEAYPVIISTRDNGKIKVDYPFNHFFNYVVVQIKADDKIFLADATEVLCPFDQVPVRCVNEKGLIIIKKGSVEWVELANNNPSHRNQEIKIKFSDDLEKQLCSVHSKFIGYEALKFRGKFNDKTDKIEEYLHNFGYKNIDSIKTNGFQNTKDAYNIEFQTQWDTEILNDKLYLSPFLIEPVSVNPLKQAKRTYPIDMTYALDRSFKTELDIPEGYKVESVPDNTNHENSLLKITYKTELREDKLIVEGCYFFKKAVYEAADYSKLKYYYNEIIKKFNQKIVLIKT